MTFGATLGANSLRRGTVYAGGEQLPIRSAAVHAGAAPAVVVDGPLMGEAAVGVLRQARRLRERRSA